MNITITSSANLNTAQSVLRNNFVIEGIRQQCPFPLLSHAFQNGHVRYNELKRDFCIPLNELMKKKTA